MAGALGFSVHTGWASVVVVEKTSTGSCTLLVKNRVELAADDHDARFVFHVAGGWPIVGSGKVRRAVAPRVSRRVIEDARKEADRRATESLTSILDAARAAGGDVQLAAFAPAKAHVDLEDLAPILASHAKVHAAETKLYALALAHACAKLGLAVVFTTSKLPKLAKQKPPWGKDEKLAAALAWSALGR
jgi:hypothetical protein